MIDPNRAFWAVLAAAFAAALSLAADTDGEEGKKGNKRGSGTSSHARCGSMQPHGKAQVIGQLFAPSAEGHVLQADQLDLEPFANTTR